MIREKINSDTGSINNKRLHLKGMPDIFLLFCILSRKGRAREAWKNVIYFTLKALFIIEVFTF